LRKGASLHFYDDDGNVENGTITALEVGRVLAFADSRGGHEVRLELAPHERGCLLVFTHSFPSDQPPAQHATGWHLCFQGLEARLEGKPMPPMAYDPELRQRYAEILEAGAADGAGRSGAEGRATARERYQPGAAGGATAHKEGDRWTLVMVRELKHSPENVWDALTDPAHLREWAPFDAERNLAATGPTMLTMVGGPTADVMECTVKRSVHPKVLEYTWGTDVLRWELQRTATGTRLTLHHTLENRTWLPKVAAGWHICLDVAERALAGHRTARIVAGDAKQFGWERLNAEYAQMFGVENTGWPEQITAGDGGR
jgi:uncharacterized protein YndB with AHSA1/START domain